jgi:hypothetical protein
MLSLALAAALYFWLVRRDFRAIAPARFAEETAGENAEVCPEPCPFSG